MNKNVLFNDGWEFCVKQLEYDVGSELEFTPVTS